MAEVVKTFDVLVVQICFDSIKVTFSTVDSYKQTKEKTGVIFWAYGARLLEVVPPLLSFMFSIIPSMMMKILRLQWQIMVW